MDYGRLFFDPPAPRSNMFFMGSNNTPSFPGARTLLSMEENPGSWKRPFFSSLPEEFIYEDEYYDDQTPAKKRRLTPSQVNLLEKSFEEENKLEPERKSELAKKLGLQPRQVAVWFQNRRARSKTKQLERDYDLLKASYDTLLSNYEAILKDNEDLKYQVISLTEKLQTKDEVLGPPIPRTSDPIQKEEEVKQAQISAQQQLSSGSSTGASSGVVNEENPQLVVDDNSGDSSNFFESPLLNLVVPQDNVSEDDIDHTPYLPCMFTVDDHHKEQERHDLGWWGWY